MIQYVIYFCTSSVNIFNISITKGHWLSIAFQLEKVNLFILIRFFAFATHTFCWIVMDVADFGRDSIELIK